MRHPLGTLLLQEHMLKEKDVFQVEECCARDHCTFEEGILKLGLLTPEILSVFKHHLPLLAPGELLEIDPELLDLLDAKLARKHLCIPVLRMGNTLILAMADPEDAEALRAIGAATGRNLDAVPALERDILGAIDYHYGPAGKATDIEEDLEEAFDLAAFTSPASSAPPAQESAKASEPAAVPESATPAPEAAPPPVVSREEIEVVIEDLPVTEDVPQQVKVANRLLACLYARGADHLEIRWGRRPQGEVSLVRSGQRESLMDIPPGVTPLVLQRYRVLGNMLLQSRKTPQRGSFEVRLANRAGQEVALQGFSIVINPVERGEAATLSLVQSGQAGAPPAAPSVCPVCGEREIRPRFRYCPTCGVPLV